MCINRLWCKSLLETNRHSRTYYRILWKENSLFSLMRFWKFDACRGHILLTPIPPSSLTLIPPLATLLLPLTESPSHSHAFLFVLALGPIEFTQGHAYEPGWRGLQQRTNVSPMATPLKTVILFAPAALDYNSIPRTGQAFPPPAGGFQAVLPSPCAGKCCCCQFPNALTTPCP